MIDSLKQKATEAWNIIKLFTDGPQHSLIISNSELVFQVKTGNCFLKVEAPVKQKMGRGEKKTSSTAFWSFQPHHSPHPLTLWSADVVLFSFWANTVENDKLANLQILGNWTDCIRWWRLCDMAESSAALHPFGRARPGDNIHHFLKELLLSASQLKLNLEHPSRFQDIVSWIYTAGLLVKKGTYQEMVITNAPH